MQRSLLHFRPLDVALAAILAAGCGRSHYEGLDDASLDAPGVALDASLDAPGLAIDDAPLDAPPIASEDASTATTLLPRALALEATTPMADAKFGNDVAAGGDVNADGVPDVLVGAFLHDADETQEGRAYVYFGGPDLLSSGRVWGVDPTDQGDAFFGTAVIGLGDLDGDGADDFAVGAPGYDVGGLDDRGRVYVYRGGASPTELLIIDGPARSNANFGYALASGDFDGDGDRDLAVGANYYPEGPPYAQGRVLVYYAASRTLDVAMPQTFQPSDGLSAAFGTDLAAADLDGDGRDDLIVGAYDWTGTSSAQGRAYAFRGGSSGLSTTVWWSSAPIDQIESHYSSSLAGIGDVTGDGAEDLVVGSWGFDGASTDEGAAFVFASTSSGPSSAASQQLVSPGGGMRPAYGFSAAGGGDFDGDGRPDLAIGGFGIDSQGAVLIYGGNGSGVTTSPRWRAAPPGQNNAQLGISVAFVGDLDGDGGDEIVSGAFLWDGAAGRDEGRIEVFSAP